MARATAGPGRSTAAARPPRRIPPCRRGAPGCRRRSWRLHGSTAGSACRSPHELPASPLLLRQPLITHRVEEPPERPWTNDELPHVLLHAFLSSLVDQPRVVVEVLEPGLVATVALVGERAERDLHHGIHLEVRKERSVCRSLDLLGRHDLFGGDHHPRG